MAGYIFAISKDLWRSVCDSNIKYGYFAPFTPVITSDILEREQSRKVRNKVLTATLGDFVTMKDGDNIYFLSDRKIYGVGRLVNIGEDCKYDNYLDASSLLPNCEIVVKDCLISKDDRARWVCFFKPESFMFLNGVDMDDVLKYRPSAFRMLRAFEGASFIKIDDDENRALKEYLFLKNEFKESKSLIGDFDSRVHDNLKKRDLSKYEIDIQKALKHVINRDYVISEMFIETALLQQLSQKKLTCIGEWDYLTHQVIASPFKPLKYIDKMDVFGYKYSEKYPEAPKLVSKYLLIELKRGKINKAALEQTMQYIDWICSEYASGDYSRIEAFVVGESAVRNVNDIIKESCQRNFIIETHPVKTQSWNNIHLIEYCIDMEESLVRFKDMYNVSD